MRGTPARAMTGTAGTLLLQGDRFVRLGLFGLRRHSPVGSERHLPCEQLVRSKGLLTGERISLLSCDFVKCHVAFHETWDAAIGG
jgi:hypothetical protein